MVSFLMQHFWFPDICIIQIYGPIMMMMYDDILVVSSNPVRQAGKKSLATVLTRSHDYIFLGSIIFKGILNVDLRKVL